MAQLGIATKIGEKNIATKNELKFGPMLLKKKPEALISYYNRKMDLLMRVMDTTIDPLTKMQKQKEINDITSAIK